MRTAGGDEGRHLADGIQGRSQAREKAHGLEPTGPTPHCPAPQGRRLVGPRDNTHACATLSNHWSIDWYGSRCLHFLYSKYTTIAATQQRTPQMQGTLLNERNTTDRNAKPTNNESVPFCKMMAWCTATVHVPSTTTTNKVKQTTKVRKRMPLTVLSAQAQQNHNERPGLECKKCAAVRVVCKNRQCRCKEAHPPS